MSTLRRLFAATCIFLPLGSYVFGIQVVYDRIKVEDEPFIKGALFLVSLIAGSATYDFAKRSLLLKTSSFNAFFKHLMSAWISVLFLLAFTVCTALILEYPSLKAHVPAWLGYLAYLFALACIPWFVIDLSKAIDAGSK